MTTKLKERKKEKKSTKVTMWIIIVDTGDVT